MAATAIVGRAEAGEIALPGRGDYVEERRELFRDLTLDEAIARARERSGGRTTP